MPEGKESIIQLFLKSSSEAINTTYSSNPGHKLFTQHYKISLSSFVLKSAQSRDSRAILLKSAVCLVKLFLASTAVSIQFSYSKNTKADI